MDNALTADERRQLLKTIRKQRIVADQGRIFDRPMPKELLTPYALQGKESAPMHNIQRKYATRRKNIRRCWNRFQLYLPELMHEGAPQKVFEMSTAHGAMLEIARHFGHEVLGNDFANRLDQHDVSASTTHRKLSDEGFEEKINDPAVKDGVALDWPYRLIIESIDIPVTLFDAGHAPYPLEDKSQDVLICAQAIEHYCHPDHWMELMDEFCRITRKTIVIIMNPLFGHFADDPEYVASFEKFRHELQRYRRNGFTTTSCHILWSEALGFKLTAD